jgi:hypothetical protein
MWEYRCSTHKEGGDLGGGLGRGKVRAGALDDSIHDRRSHVLGLIACKMGGEEGPTGGLSRDTRAGSGECHVCAQSMTHTQVQLARALNE